MRTQNQNPIELPEARPAESRRPARLSFLCALLLFPFIAPAQTTSTNGQTSGQGSFFQTTIGYFSSFNTNLDATFGSSRGAVWTGVDSIQGGGATLANTIGISYDIWKPSAPTNTASGAGPGHLGLSLESTTRNGGVTGTIISSGAGLGLSFVVHDVKLTAYAEGVYNFAESKNQFGGEIGLRVFKALTDHTFAGVGIAEQFPGNRQIFSAFVGFVF